MNKGILIFFLIIGIVHTVGATTTPSFVATPTTGTAPLEVHFTDTSSGNPVAWKWVLYRYFDDVSKSRYLEFSSEQNPTYILYEGGYTFGVQLETKSADGIWTRSDFTKITVLPATFPTPSFTMYPTSGKVPLTVQFHGTSTGIVEKWLWWGDWQTSSDFTRTYTASHACSDGEVKEVCVHVEAINTSPIYGSKNIKSSAPQCLKLQVDPSPVSSFTATPSSGPAPLTVVFTDTSSGSPDVLSWDFGDGTKQNQNYAGPHTPSHTYTISGVYTVTLDARKSTSCNYDATTVSKTISVLSPLDPKTTTLATTAPTGTTTTVPNTTITTAANTVKPTTVPTTVLLTETTVSTITTSETPTSIRSPTRKATTKIPTSLPTDIPTEPSPIGIEVVVIASIGAALLVVNRK